MGPGIASHPTRIGIEIVEDRIAALRVDDRGKVQARQESAALDPASVTQELLRHINVLTIDLPRTIGIAVDVPDVPDIAAIAEAVRTTANPAALEIVPRGAAAAIAECWIGAARAAQDLVYLAAGDRTVAGIVRGGAPVAGAHGRAASVAWLALNPVEREDYRKVGCLETEVAAGGIVRRLIWRIKTGDRSAVEELVNGNLADVTVDHVLAAAREGDGVAISVVRDTAKYLGMAAANIVVIEDPHALVLGGIMASAGDVLMGPLRAEITRRLPRAMLDTLAIATAALGADAAAIGAARLASGPVA